ncbi:unnamed protein product [Euphydryas editha]|uniref:Uncharacterized protein n=1 Tax=Euphydryas editha TaxID=104508 RepID=A0AAU9TLV9_EUPED|nr:unnamed protein product [Euphydryas editha]
MTSARFPLRTNDNADVLGVAIFKGFTLVLRSIETLPELNSDYRSILIQLEPDPSSLCPRKSSPTGRNSTLTHSDIPDRIDTVQVAKVDTIGLTSHVKSTSSYHEVATAIEFKRLELHNTILSPIPKIASRKSTNLGRKAAKARLLSSPQYKNKLQDSLQKKQENTENTMDEGKIRRDKGKKTKSKSEDVQISNSEVENEPLYNDSSEDSQTQK